MLRTEAPIITQIALHTSIGTVKEQIFELKGSLVSFEIFEEIDNPEFSSSANLVVRDVDNTIYPLIIGQEMVQFVFQQANNETSVDRYQKVFQVKQANKTLDSSGRQIVVIHCLNPYKVVGSNAYFQKTFTDTSSEFSLNNIFETIETGFDNMKPAIYKHDFEDSLFPRTFCVPNRTYEWVVNYWINNAVVEGNNVFQALFFFWDDKNGLHFKSNRALIEQQPKTQLYLVNNIAQAIWKKQFIQKWEVQAEFDQISKIKNAIQVPVTYSFVDKTYKEGKYKEDKSKDVNKVTEEKPQVSYDLTGKSTKKIFTGVFDNTLFNILQTESTLEIATIPTDVVPNENKVEINEGSTEVHTTPKGIHQDLIAVVEKAKQYYQGTFKIIEGLRTIERQRELVRKGASKTMRSRHLTGHAVDIAPFVGNTIPWNDWQKFEEVSKAIKQAAAELNIPIEWGGDWKTFKDGPHYQLPWKQYPG